MNTPIVPYPLGQGSVDETPWPGGSNQIVERAAPAISGEARILIPGAPAWYARDDFPWRSICSWRSPRAVPVVLGIRASDNVNIGATSPYSAEAWYPTQLSCPAGTSTKAAALRVVYGSLGVLRTIEADVKSGSYQLPPCDAVTVEARAYALGPTDFTVSASVTPGSLHAEGARFTATLRPAIAAGASRTEPLPFSARWMALSGTDATAIAAGQPVIRAVQPGGVFLLHDFATGTFISQPGQPVELSNRSPVIIYNDGPTAQYVTAKFFLEL